MNTESFLETLLTKEEKLKIAKKRREAAKEKEKLDRKLNEMFESAFEIK